MIQPFLKDMTMSELHAIMVGGFATIAGSVLGAYISFGVRKIQFCRNSTIASCRLYVVHLMYIHVSYFMFRCQRTI